MLYILLSTLTGAFALGFCKFFAWEALCAELGDTQRPWLIQAIGSIMTIGPVLAFFVASPWSQKAPAGKIMAFGHLGCVAVIGVGYWASFGGSPWLYLLLMGFGSGIYSAARQSAIPRLCQVDQIKAVKLTAAVSVAFVVGLLAGFPSGAKAYQLGLEWALSIMALALVLSAGFALKIPQPPHQKGDAGFAWVSLFPESLAMLTDHVRVLLVSPLLWSITGAISLAVTAFAVTQKLGSPAQCSLISLYAALGCIAGNGLSPYFEKNSRRSIGLSTLGMALLTLGIPLFTASIKLVLSPSLSYVALSLWMAVIGVFFGMASNLLDAQFLMKVSLEKRDGLGAALLSALISACSFVIGGFIAVAILWLHIGAQWQFSLLGGLLLLATLPILWPNSDEDSVQGYLPALACSLIGFSLRLRYRLRVQQPEYSGSKGRLFLPNHPALIDPVILVSLLWKKHRIVPIVDEAMYNNPSSHWIMKRLGALPLPDMSTSGGWYARHEIEICLQNIQDKLNQGQSILIYPAGKIMRGSLEKLGANSGVHAIISGCNDNVEIIAVRTRGLLGSSFSCAFNGGIVPNLGIALKRALLCAVSNGLFFLKKREVSIAMETMELQSLRSLSREDLNHKLEAFYAVEGAEEAQILPYGPFRSIVPVLGAAKAQHEGIEVLPQDFIDFLKPKLTELSGRELAKLEPEMTLEDDFGLDSIARAELQTFMEEELELEGLQMTQMRTLADLAKVFQNGSEEISEVTPSQLYSKKVQSPLFEVSYDSIQENILAMLQQRRQEELFVDKSGQNMSVQKFHIGLLLLAQHFRKLEQQRIAVMLPASIGSTLTVGALILAGKTPLMLNFTSGIKNIKASMELTKAELMITSSRFLSKLKGVDLDDFADKMHYLEKLNLSATDKAIAWYWSKTSLLQQKKYLNLDKLDKNATACILFTSGSESLPKAVPLSHKNLLSNIRGALQAVDFKADDVMLGFLPPFHSFGLTIGTLLPLVTGLRTAYHPNPLDSKALASLAKSSNATLVLGTPAFLSAICAKMKAPWTCLRYAVSGAEKAPESLFETLGRLAPQAQILEGYGSTECSPVITLNRPHQKRVGVGQPFHGVEVIIVDETKSKELPVGEKGLILVKGDSVFSGYLNSDKNPFVQWKGFQWYNTEDLGCMSEEGHVLLMGRLKRFVKISGEMISLPALEIEIRAEYEAKDAPGPQLALESVEKEGEKTQIVLFSCLPLGKDSVNELLKQKGFPTIARITSVRQIESIPLIGTGKIDYRKLKELCRAENG